jgi:hypothetical protein
VFGGAQTRSGLGDPHFGESEGNGLWGEEGRKGWWAVFRLSKAGGEFGALQSGLTLHPRATHLGDLQLSPPSLTPSPLNAAAGQSPYKSVEAGSSESSAPWSERVILPTPRKRPVIHSGLCTRSSRDEENLVEDQKHCVGWRERGSYL